MAIIESLYSGTFPLKGDARDVANNLKSNRSFIQAQNPHECSFHFNIDRFHALQLDRNDHKNVPVMVRTLSCFTVNLVFNPIDNFIAIKDGTQF
ncbi:MAG: hypothetical protein ACI82A_001541 [Candidatus Azotimanducaceae bacterium]|jgi:hypothetical protein